MSLITKTKLGLSPTPSMYISTYMYICHINYQGPLAQQRSVAGLPKSQGLKQSTWSHPQAASPWAHTNMQSARRKRWSSAAVTMRPRKSMPPTNRHDRGAAATGPKLLLPCCAFKVFVEMCERRKEKELGGNSTMWHSKVTIYQSAGKHSPALAWLYR
jgi:hypothetical protein